MMAKQLITYRHARLYPFTRHRTSRPIHQYSQIPVTRMFEVGCGPASHLPELIRRGYGYVGLDLSPDMLAYARSRVQDLQASVLFVEADIRSFHLPEQVDFAFVLLDSLFVQNTAELTAHFDMMSGAKARRHLSVRLVYSLRHPRRPP